MSYDMTITSNNWDMMETNELSLNANGGSEQMLKRIYDGYIPRNVLEQFQIIPSRVRELNPDKFRVYIINDLPEDPEVAKALSNDGWNKFHKIIFVSHIQAQIFIAMYNIPWSKTMVVPNAITPIPVHEKPTDKVNLIYHTTPHRGLNILLSVYDAIVKKHPNVHLDVYSSFKLYGWEQQDEQFKPLFDFCKNHDKITYHGSVSNDEVRQALQKAHIFAYPSVWTETSCLCLIEAMSAGLTSVHPDLGALPETAANWTNMYRFNEKPEDHARLFASLLDITIQELNSENHKMKVSSQKTYVDVFYNWETRKLQWEALLRGIIGQNEPKEISGEMFTYRA